MNMKTETLKSTVEVYDRNRIEWCRSNPDKLTRRQRHQARIAPETHGALPTMLFTGRSPSQAEAEAMPYRGPDYLVRIN
jgi:hypothetical protein